MQWNPWRDESTYFWHFFFFKMHVNLVVFSCFYMFIDVSKPRGSLHVWSIFSKNGLEETRITLRASILDLSDGQFSERCDVDGSYFNSDAIPIIFGKA